MFCRVKQDNVSESKEGSSKDDYFRRQWVSGNF